MYKFHPLNETQFLVVRGLIHKEVSPEESSTEHHSYNHQVNRSQLQCQDLSEHCLDKIRKAFSS